jgi:hypothetical protein
VRDIGATAGNSSAMKQHTMGWFSLRELDFGLSWELLI